MTIPLEERRRVDIPPASGATFLILKGHVLSFTVVRPSLSSFFFKSALILSHVSWSVKGVNQNPE